MKLSLHLFCPQLPKLDERAFIPGGDTCLQVKIAFREIGSVLRLYGRFWESPASRMVTGRPTFGTPSVTLCGAMVGVILVSSKLAASSTA
jgi:hypothetical protein